MTLRGEKLGPGHVAARVRRRWLAIAALGLLSTVAACQRTDSPTPGVDGTDASADAPAAQIWESFYLQGAKIGYAHTSVQPLTQDGRKLVETRTQNHLVITRFGQRTAQDVELESLETPAGELLEFKTKVTLGPSPTIVTGRAQNGQMAITTRTKGRRGTTRIPWSSDIGGFRAIEHSLARGPMEPGQRRSLRMLMPLVNQIAEVELTAHEVEKTPVLGVEATLLRIEAVAQLSGGTSISSTMWTDDQGEVIRSRIAAMDQETYRTSEASALAPPLPGKSFDLGLDLIVKVEPPLADAHEKRRVRYRVELAAGDPAASFATGPTQSIRSLGGGAAEVTVERLRPGDLPAAEKPQAAASEYTKANSMLQIDDPRIRQMADEAKGEAANPKDVALALERYVHRAINEKNFSQAFSTAAEVAESREGDCTEHAVLLAALARACGIPSRVAIGLVYVDHAGGFGYHMWTEVYLEGQWVPLDAIMGHGGTSAAYLKLADSSLAGADAYSSILAVAGVLGQLKVSVLEAE